MRTLGIDLSTSPLRTAAAVIDWRGEEAIVDTPHIPCGDDQLLELLLGLKGGDQAGVDCPFGWPAPFVAAMAAHAAPHPTWPGRDTNGTDDLRALRFRRTDLIVADQMPRDPLSVSFDKLGAMAARWARLQARLAHLGHSVDRTGAGPVAEVYPAAARRRWGLVSGTLDELESAAPWLHIPEQARTHYAARSHAYDALIAALVARAVATGLTTPPSPSDIELARSEGWIHLPGPASLEQLPTALSH
ncbi:DUF429 domain-containing protein [Streptomyces sp. T-3]|nr:DUF429 domain-containing protein [Streptomyces sp. T-3]